MYLTIKQKFTLCLLFAISWITLSSILALPWIITLSTMIGIPLALFIVSGIALIPGFMNAFLIAGLMVDRRPNFTHKITKPISILIACYNEEQNIQSTIESIYKQDYQDTFEVIVINDGSTDNTKDILDSLSHFPNLTIIHLANNVGKAKALNHGLKSVKYDLTITVDGDSYLYNNALRNLVYRYHSDPKNTVAVAGAVLVRNSRKNLVTKLQEWDYFHGIASIKRLQSLCQGTLVAQGAFSLYETQILKELGGWKDTIGEDIVLTWSMLDKGYRVGFAENACLFTNAPETLTNLIKQRERWARGMIEAFKYHWRLLFKKKYITLFIWWNLLFPILDVVYTFVFIPGIILAFFGYYYIAGIMTIIVLPLGLLVNYIMFRKQSKMFKEQGLKVRYNPLGFILYVLFYGLILQPASLLGYFKEVLKFKKKWGTK